MKKQREKNTIHEVKGSFKFNKTTSSGYITAAKVKYLVRRLKKNLYGLKQGPRCCQERFGGYLRKRHFTASKADAFQKLYVVKKNDGQLNYTAYIIQFIVTFNKFLLLGVICGCWKKTQPFAMKNKEYFLRQTTKDIWRVGDSTTLKTSYIFE